MVHCCVSGSYGECYLFVKTPKKKSFFCNSTQTDRFIASMEVHLLRIYNYVSLLGLQTRNFVTVNWHYAVPSDFIILKLEKT